MMAKPLFLFAIIAGCLALPVQAKTTIGDLRKKPDDWFSTDEARQYVDNIVSWQNANGGWSKGYDLENPRAADSKLNWRGQSTFDNGATHTELRTLARAYHATQRQAYADAFGKGLAFLFESQYPNGGWPQRWPSSEDYGREITYNDNAMVGIMRVLLDVSNGKEPYAFTTSEQRQKAREAFDRGVDCILNTQIKVKGQLAGWCQQHDAKTLAPIKARSYELPSISGGESSEIAILLMEIDSPSERIVAAIEGCAAWYKNAVIVGKRIENFKNDAGESDKRVVDDPASIAWARFYDLETGKPFFSDRAGVKYDDWTHIERERRTGYAWYGNWGTKVEKAYAEWKTKNGR